MENVNHTSEIINSFEAKLKIYVIVEVWDVLLCVVPQRKRNNNKVGSQNEESVHP